jgi:hypothetical protein
MPPSKKDLLLEPVPLTFPAPARRPWIGPPGMLALIVGAVFGLLFGGIVGDLIGAGVLGAPIHLGEFGGAILGMAAGVVFVLLALLLYRFIEGPAGGALVLGLFGLIAAGLVGGLFGAVIGLLAGVMLGAFFGAVKAEDGLGVGPVWYPNQSAPLSPWNYPPPEQPRPVERERRSA